MPNLPWACSCGRKVPWSIAVCRCGKPRPEPGATLAAGAELIAQRPSQQASGVDWSWLPKVLGVLALVGLYFGSRMFNKYSASKEARGAAEQALARVVDAKVAKDAVGKHHEVCFEQYYKTGWGRRQSSKFETEKYARCILDKSVGQIQNDVSAARVAAAREAQERRAAQRQQVAAAAVSAPAPTSSPTQRPEWGQVSLGDVKVAEWKREPQLRLKVGFVALGNNLTREAHCAFTVHCETRPVRPPLVTACPLQVQGVKGVGTLEYVEPGPAPAGVACSLELQLSDGRSTRTNKVQLALR
jgi:hypothetical protein